MSSTVISPSAFAQAHAEQGVPSSVHVEIAILGAMLLDAVAINDATARLLPDDFSLDSHQRIYRVMLSMQSVGQAVDLITVAEALSNSRELDTVGGQKLIVSDRR